MNACPIIKNRKSNGMKKIQIIIWKRKKNNIKQVKCEILRLKLTFETRYDLVIETRLHTKR